MRCFGSLLLAVSLAGAFETDLFSLLGDGGCGSAFTEASEKMASTYRVLCDSRELAEKCRGIADFDPDVDPKEMYELVRTHGKGLLGERHRELLEAWDTNRVARSAMRRDYSGVGLFPKEDDPYYFLNDFALELSRFRPSVPEGAVLLTGSVSGDASRDAPRLAALIALAREEPGVHLGGAPFHSYLATESSRREIGALGTVSLVAAFALGFALFGGARFALPLLFALAAGFFAGTLAVFALPGRPHVLTLIFGTSLVGLGVDYCYHAMSKRPDDGEFRFRLACAFVTTALSFAPLVLSSVAVLRQMAVFTVAGLCAIYLVAAFVLRPCSPQRPAPQRRFPARAGRWIRLAVFAAAAAGLFRIEFGNDPSSFHRADPLMASGEAAVAKAAGDGLTRFRVVDLAAWQTENAALKERMGQKPGGEFLSAADLPRAMTFESGGRCMAILPSEKGIDPRAELEAVFEGCAKETNRLLAFSFAVLAAALLIAFRRKFLLYVVPVAMAAVATAGVLGWIGEKVSFFHLLCFFVLAGLGIDYAIFNRGRGDGDTGRVVLYSFLTSLVGFGMLSFTAFQVTRSMGITLGTGLFFAYIFSLPSSAPPRRDADAKWSDQPEQSAGRLRLKLMWWTYRFLGKSFAKVVTFFVMLFIYPHAKAARAALSEFAGIVHPRLAPGRRPPRPFSVMLNFAWAMLDKVDACTLAKNLPRMSVSGDDGWMKGGCFLVTTHVGCAEVLPALRRFFADGGGPEVHAFQQMGHDRIFTELFCRHLDSSRFTLHAVEDIGVETAVEMQEAIRCGAIVIMAGDRPSAGSPAVLRREFLGRDCAWPKGVFRFAALMHSPVYAVGCVRTGWNAYEVRARRLGGNLLGDYVEFLEEETLSHPEQWFHFYRFFG